MPGQYWQEVLDQLCLCARKDGTLKKVEKLHSEEDLIRYFAEGSYRDELLKWIIDTQKSSSWRKCSTKAKLLREKGNKQFQMKDYEGCISTYTESMKYAPTQSEELSLSLGNRSAALFHSNLFEEAVKDIHMAFKSGYPKHLHYKLHQRKGDCMMQLGQFKDALVEFQLAQETLKDLKDVPSSKKALISKAIENASFSVQNLNTTDRIINNETDASLLPVPFNGQSTELAYASQALSLQNNEQEGRHVIALCDISVGDVLFVEKPYAFVLLPKHYPHRCHHCCVLFKAPVPCLECSVALFCSEECRISSWNQYHRWECFAGLHIMHSVGIAHLGLRVVLKAGSAQEHKSFKNILVHGTNNREHYSEVYHLVTHLESMSAEDRTAYTLTAVCLMLYLIHCTDYFNQNRAIPSEDFSSETTNDHVMIGGLLLHHICQLVCNGHAITAVVTNPNAGSSVLFDVKQVRIATAIYPSASMMNHSCDSNIINSFFGTHLIVKAYKNIKKGGEVFNCYGPNFRTMPRKDRKEALKAQYHFDCLCEACSDEYDFQEQFISPLCRVCQGPVQTSKIKHSQMVCSNCGAHFESSECFAAVNKADSMFEEGLLLLEEGCLKQALKHLLACLDLQKKCLYRNHIQRRTCLDSIAKCYAKLGDYRNSVSFVTETLPAIEEQFGALSIEMAHELHKLTDLMIADLIKGKYQRNAFLKKHSEAQKQVQKTKEIFELHYGPWSSALQEVIEKEKNLNGMCHPHSDCK